MSDGIIIAAITAMGVAVGYIIKALAEKSSLSTNAAANRTTANASDASATAVVVAAARELVDPLRKELAQERAEHSEEILIERGKVAQLRAELQSAMDESRELRIDLHRLRDEMTRLQQQNEDFRARIAELERI